MNEKFKEKLDKLNELINLKEKELLEICYTDTVVGEYFTFKGNESQLAIKKLGKRKRLVCRYGNEKFDVQEQEFRPVTDANLAFRILIFKEPLLLNGLKLLILEKGKEIEDEVDKILKQFK